MDGEENRENESEETPEEDSVLLICEGETRDEYRAEGFEATGRDSFKDGNELESTAGLDDGVIEFGTVGVAGEASLGKAVISTFEEKSLKFSRNWEAKSMGTKGDKL